MNKKKKILSIILIINLLISLICSIYMSKSYAATKQEISSKIDSIDDKKYPGIKSMIKDLQAQHPNWNFKVLYTKLDWNTVITEESKHGRNLVGKNQKNYAGDWICSVCENKTYSGGNWLCASSEAIEYMMDPRNSIYYEDVFQFLELSYDKNTTYNSKIIKSILSGSFLDDGNLDSYITTIINKGKDYNVNPYYIAGKIIQEQGKKGGSTFKMQDSKDKTKYYYNIFNINATGKTVDAIIQNALSWAKDKGWDTIEKCLIGGIQFISNGYISVGQDTMYFEKFDVIADTYYSHQYAQDVLYAQNQGEKLRKILENINAINNPYTFVIPLYENMPKNACKRPSIVKTEDTYDLGDPNGDKVINSSDLLIVLKHLLKTKVIKNDKQLKAMDINKDNVVNSTDLLMVKKHLLGTYKITK